MVGDVETMRFRESRAQTTTRLRNLENLYEIIFNALHQQPHRPRNRILGHHNTNSGTRKIFDYLIQVTKSFSFVARRHGNYSPPPSKRQRTEAAERARQQQDIEEVPSDAGSLRLQFCDETTGLPIGQGPVLVPVADASPKNLELVLNTLLGNVGSKFYGCNSPSCFHTNSLIGSI